MDTGGRISETALVSLAMDESLNGRQGRMDEFTVKTNQDIHEYRAHVPEADNIKVSENMPAKSEYVADWNRAGTRDSIDDTKAENVLLNSGLTADFEHSDSSSVDSNTPLLRADGHLSTVVLDNVTCTEVNETVDESKTTNNDVFLSQNQIYHNANTQSEVNTSKANDEFDLNAQIVYDMDQIIVEEVIVTPVNVIGSGWEFGSVASIHRQELRSRSNTVDRQGHYDSNRNLGDRLLSRVFSKAISNIELDKKGSVLEDLNKSFLTEEGYEPAKTIPNLKNLIVVSIGLTFLHISFTGLRNLQSSLNASGGIGVYSLAATCASFMLGSLGSPFLVQMFRPKRCLVFGVFGNVFYVFANYYPTFYTILPTSFIMGISNALLWNAVSTYVTEIGINEAARTNKKTDNVLSKFFGICFLSLQIAMIFGNLISSLILTPKSGEMSSDSLNVTSKDSIVIATNETLLPYNVSAYSDGITQLNTTASHCGIGSCHESQSNMDIDDLDKLFLLGTYASCNIIATLVIQLLLDQLPDYIPSRSSAKQVLHQAGSVIKMVVDPQFAFLLMLCCYTVISNGFVTADALKAYVTCPMSIYMVGYTMICFGVCGAISSYMFGKLVKHIGRIPVFTIASVINLASLAFMFTWTPTADDMYYIFALIGGWGFADGIWQSQINSLISTVFSDRYELAFGCCRIVQGFGGILVYGMSNILCMQAKVLLTAVTCLLALILYIIMELKRQRHQDTVVMEATIDIKLNS